MALVTLWSRSVECVDVQFWLQAIYGAAILIAVTLDALVTRQVQRLLVARRARE